MRYAAGRLLLVAPMLLGVAAVVFALMQLVPGDPAVVLLGQDATPEAVATLRRTLGLDRPIPVQFVRYVGGAVRGDLGQSIFRNEPVLSAVASRLPATVELASAALLFAVLAGVGLGVLAAVRRGTAWDTAGMVFAQLGVSMPVFWLGILLMFWFAVRLDWLPAVGRGEPLARAVGLALAGRPEPLAESVRHLVLPALALGLNSAAVVSRLVRAAMLDALDLDFVRTATAKGLARWRVVTGHALRHALLPAVNVVGLRFGALLGGAVLTESIFGWPGLGQLAVTAISQRDLPLVQGAVLVFALLFALVNLGVDLLNAWLDPRIRVEAG